MDQQSKDLGEMLAALQDDVELMKTEIRQTLVDLREFFVKDRTISAQTLRGPRSNGAPLDPYPLSPAVPTSDSNRHPETSLWDSRSEARGNERVDTIMLGDIIRWLSTVKDRGLSLQQVAPFLEAYEASGHLPPTVVKLIGRSFSNLDGLEEDRSNGTASPKDLLECLFQFHSIVCTPGYVTDESNSSARSRDKAGAPS